MKIASILMVHGDTECVRDTIEAIQSYVTNDILMVVDGASWKDWGKEVDLPVHKICGLYHNHPQAPYRNITLALSSVIKLFPDADWYSYTEYDTLFCSSNFKEDLRKAEVEKVWCMGNDCRSGELEMPLIESMLKTEIPVTKYLLGCCIFYYRDFLLKLKHIDFFDKFLFLTNDFANGFFPGYLEQGGCDFAEHLYPTLAYQLGGKVRGQAFYDEEGWHGNYERYPIRWIPELDPETEIFPDAYIIHPLKTYDNPIRAYHREKRK